MRPRDKYQVDRINTSFLMNIFAICNSLGLASTQYEFSSLCGKSLGWCSAMKCLNLPLSTEVAMRLILRLGEYSAQDGIPQRSKQDAEYLRTILKNVVYGRVRETPSTMKPADFYSSAK